MGTTVETVTRDQIQQLRREAGEAGDMEQVRLCEAALRTWGMSATNEHRVALRKCVAVISDAEAQS